MKKPKSQNAVPAAQTVTRQFIQFPNFQSHQTKTKQWYKESKTIWPNRWMLDINNPNSFTELFDTKHFEILFIFQENLIYFRIGWNLIPFLAHSHQPLFSCPAAYCSQSRFTDQANLNCRSTYLHLSTIWHWAAGVHRCWHFPALSQVSWDFPYTAVNCSNQKQLCSKWSYYQNTNHHTITMGPITNRTVLGNLGHIFLESNLMLNELRKIRKTTLIFFYFFLMRNNTNFWNGRWLN